MNALALAFAAAAFALAIGPPSADPDMWWHLASGKWMVGHGSLLGIDVFSSTATGETYALGEPLGQVVLYLAFAAGSWLGLALLRATLVAIAAFAVARLALRFAAPLYALPLAAVALLASVPVWTDRPQLWTLALFPLVLDLALTARAPSRRALVAAAAVVVLWAELHAGYALGLALLWLLVVDAFLGRRALGAKVTAALAATALAPALPGALFPVRALLHIGGPPARILEETPVDPLTPFGALFALFVAAVAASLLSRRVDRFLVLLVVPLLLLALTAQRHIPLFVFASVPLIAATLPVRPFALRRASLLAAAMWSAAVASVVVTAPRADETRYPAGAKAALEASSGILLNEYDWGGWLIWNVPSRPVFIDGRLYPFTATGVLDDYERAVHARAGWLGVIDRYSVSQALLRPDRPLAQALRDEGWTAVAQDATFVLLERPR